VVDFNMHIVRGREH